MCLLTDIDVGQQRGGQAEHQHQYVGHGQVDDEIVGDVAHPGRPVHHGHDQQVAHQAHQEHHGVRETEDGRHGRAVPVPEFAGAAACATAAAAGVAVTVVAAVGHGVHLQRDGQHVVVAEVRRTHAGPVAGERGAAGLGGRHRSQHVEQRVAQHVHQARFDDHPSGWLLEHKILAKPRQPAITHDRCPSRYNHTQIHFYTVLHCRDTI